MRKVNTREEKGKAEVLEQLFLGPAGLETVRYMNGWRGQRRYGLNFTMVFCGGVRLDTILMPTSALCTRGLYWAFSVFCGRYRLHHFPETSQITSLGQLAF